jgi:hypothetical protein
MFDPLTAATMTLDDIVEMCDELIAAHGDLLPKLDGKKTLVPTSGKTFGPVDPKVLRQSWDEVHRKSVADYITSWHVIGPFKDKSPENISLELATSVEQQLVKANDGSIDLNAFYSDGNGTMLKWTKATARRKGNVNFDDSVGRHEFAVAYGYAEIESIHPRQAELRCGSDDGIKIWLNGKLIHTHEIRRGFAPDSDCLTVNLQAGTNRILVKVDNYRAGWGFGVAVSKPNF